MTERDAKVRNGAGIHCRPSALIVERVRDYEGSVEVSHAGESSDLRSVMGLMALELQQGESVRVRVDGENEASVCRMLVDLFETAFDFPPRTAA